MSKDISNISSLNEYGYIFPKLAKYHSFIMSNTERNRIKQFSKFKNLKDFIELYFPGLPPTSELENSPVLFEYELSNVFFRYLKRIYSYSPRIIQDFIENYLVKYEIENIKNILINFLLRGDVEVKKITTNDSNDKTVRAGGKFYMTYGNITNFSEAPDNQIFSQLIKSKELVLYKKPVILMNNLALLKNMKKIQTIDDIIYLFSFTKYRDAIQIGLEKFIEENEIYYLIQELDAFYYKQFYTYVLSSKSFIKQRLFPYISYILDYYNLHLIFRTIYNGIDLATIQTCLIPHGNYIKQKELDQFMRCSSLHDFFHLLNELSREEAFFHEIFEETRNEINLWDIYLERVNNKISEIKLYDVSLKTLTFNKIVDFLINKELEIDFARQQALKLRIKRMMA